MQDMGRMFLLALWSLLCVSSLASSKAVISCKDQDTCKHLRIVTSNSNEIPAVLQRYNQAESIDLHGNLMESFFGHDISSARQLKALNLSYNLLTSETQLNFGSYLEEIDITYNQWNYVQVPTSVKKFVAVRNKLVEVRFAGNNVEQLILSKNRLSKIPEIDGQYNLMELDMSCNEISEVNFDNFANLRNIKTLNLANNRIYQTTGNSPLNSLQRLDLSHNILTIIDESMDSVSNVKELNLRNNQIVVIIAPKNPAQKRFFSLRHVDFAENDWDCKSLEIFFENRNFGSAQDTSCSNGNLGSQGLCCIRSQSPYADRVIRYNQRNYEALQNSSTIREHGVDCTNYKPSPCDGDDIEVYRVANVAEPQKLQASVDDLVKFIQQLYQTEGYQKESDPLQQLKHIFESLDANHTAINNHVNEEEQQIQNILMDIRNIEEDMKELAETRDRLIDDINARNEAIEEHKQIIEELKGE